MRISDEKLNELIAESKYGWKPCGGWIDFCLLDLKDCRKQLEEVTKLRDEYKRALESGK